MSRPQPTAAPAVEEPTAAPAVEEAAFSVGQVTDVGGIDDKSFNQTAWAGVQRAMEELGVDGVFLESQQQTDYEKNLNEFISQEQGPDHHRRLPAGRCHQGGG